MKATKTPVVPAPDDPMTSAVLAQHARTVVEFARRDHPAAHRRQGWCTASALEVRSVIANFDGAGGDAIISLSPARGGLALSGMADWR